MVECALNKRRKKKQRPKHFLSEMLKIMFVLHVSKCSTAASKDRKNKKKIPTTTTAQPVAATSNHQRMRVNFL